MVDIVTTAYTIIFIKILLMIGIVVFGTIADPMGDTFYINESALDATDCTTPFVSTVCSDTVANPSIENVTRAQPVAYNCTATMGSCVIMTAGTHYNFTANDGLIYVIDDDYNGTIYVSYWSDTALASADRAQQSITGTVYGGFDLATVMVIVMAAVGIVGTIFLIGRRGA